MVYFRTGVHVSLAGGQAHSGWQVIKLVSGQLNCFSLGSAVWVELKTESLLGYFLFKVVELP